MILIAFVENSFKHSLSSQAEDIFIKIKAEVKNRRLFFECANTYVETSNTSDEYLSKGIGLENVHKRLELQYPEKYKLETQTKDNMYFVRLQLDL